ncbi:MAG: hypothetical protein IPK64_18960 [bacterium]|nr:hypothetical protein [bacterium]
MTENPSASPFFECVEPEIGGQMDLLGQADLEPGLAARLRGHLAMCDACRLDRALARRLPEALAALEQEQVAIAAAATTTSAGSPRARVVGGHARFRRQAGSWGGLALAAGLALVVMMPPVPAGGNRLQRGDQDGPRFVRPVEGEVVSTGTPRLNWTPIEGASAYRVRVESTDGTYRWEATVKGTTARAPAAATAPAGVSLRAYLEPVPADLAPAGGIAVAYRAGSRGESLRYRAVAAPLYARLLAAGGALAVAAAVAVGLAKRG